MSFRLILKLAWTSGGRQYTPVVEADDQLVSSRAGRWNLIGMMSHLMWHVVIFRVGIMCVTHESSCIILKAVLFSFVASDTDSHSYSHNFFLMCAQ